MLRVVLVRPEGPINVGLVQRACANFGPAELHVVGGAEALDHPDRRRMAHGAVREPVRCARLDEAISGTTWACGFVGRPRRHRRVWPLPWVAPRLEERARSPRERLALVFGNERTGLRDDEVADLQELVTIPTSPAHPSVNLAGAVHVALAFVSAPSPTEPLETRSGRPITFGERLRLVESAERGFAGAENGEEMRRAVRRLFGRAEIESRDARLWHRWLRRHTSR